MKNLLVAASAVLALSVIGPGEAFAQHYRCNSNFGGRNVYRNASPGFSVSIGYGNMGRGYYGGSGFNQGFGGYPVYGGHNHQVWHDTSHLDYHAPSLVPHRGHYDYVPGHYHLHRTGHWDVYHH